MSACKIPIRINVVVIRIWSVANALSLIAHARIAGLRASKLYKPTSGVGAGLGASSGFYWPKTRALAHAYARA